MRSGIAIRVQHNTIYIRSDPVSVRVGLRFHIEMFNERSKTNRKPGNLVHNVITKINK